MEELEEAPQTGGYIYFKGGRISKILAYRKREGTNQREKLCKFHSKSYMHVEWLTDSDIKKKNIQNLKQSQRNIDAAEKVLADIQEKYG